MDNRVLLFYKNKLNSLSKEVNKYNNINKYTAVGKLASFIFAVGLFIFWYFNSIFNILFLTIPFLVYIFLIIFGQKYIDLYTKNKNLYELISDEISFLNKNYDVFRPNIHFIEYTHNYAYDLDIFEKGALYHSINRCTTADGEELLQQLLLNPKRSSEDIIKMQDSVKEMMPLREVSHNISSISYKNPVSLDNFIKTVSRDITPPKKIAVIYVYISASATILSFIAYGFGLIPSFIPLGLFIYQFTTASLFAKKTNDEYSKLNKANNAAKIYLLISETIKDNNFQSEMLKSIKDDMCAVSSKVKELQKINSEFDQRNSGLYYLISNGLFLRDIILSYKINKWIKENIYNIPVWNKAAAYIDVINSISVFGYNNSDFIFPVINSSTIIKAENMSHPLIDSLKRVGNNIEINKTHKFLIITGANMAGKSTFIRSIGVNLILASMGAPVCASSFEFSSVDIFSSMRTSDKLMDSSSYFHAELQRLKLLKEKAEKSEKMLVLLDEILKGTNSQDKLQGSKLVLLKFIKLNITGILATHDTALGSLSEEYIENFENYFFDFDIDEIGEMHFDYKLKKGISNNMNASILLKNVLND
ncbi:MutS-related protein [Mucispirillum schaedleri]|jgi:DNA mismatch repair ATPase MutS|uniref:DNA mismatch repair protein MutS n=1 Tax=Mucispirillum schaedleri ASF457 TaxID=1379858 RepID=V2PXS0_9BACT|nr:hypothetical protein [Mucispirillum schaedleri]MCX4360238.1 hypothetical protein [Mucispirillum schaedleri]USF23094.1 DNA mismatch repair protein MutS [Mucispirillum schaedleri ASF457]SIW04757.1 conserved membrane hypothetical protein [Mucispirillum schaedleri ASF457]